MKTPTTIGRSSSLFAVWLAFCGAITAQAQTPDTLQHYIAAPPVGAQSGAGLGFSVAVDGSRTVVGAPFDDLHGENSGVVKVFDSGSGALLHVIPNPTPAGGDNFGYSVAISGTRVVVGAPFDNTGANSAGSAYVYDLSSGTPTVPMATLNNPGPVGSDNFGVSVGISGTRVVVGAYQDDTGASNAGSAYVYDLSSGTPAVPITTLNNPGPAVGDFFGISVAISGTRVVVGASSDDTGATDAGSAYVYDLSSGTQAVPVATLNNPGPAVGDFFGISVAISGTRVVVGAYRDDTGASNGGSAYVYNLTSGTPTVPVATLNNPTPAIDDQFGVSVAISATRVVVGANQDNPGPNDAGSAFVYDLSSGTPTVPVATLNNPGPAADDQFGISVAISGTRVVVGAHLDDTGAVDAGSAYVYDLSSGTPTVPVATLNNPGPAADDSFGVSVAISGTRVVVGASGDDTGASNAGSAYVYDLSSGTPTVPVVTLNNPSPAANDRFGISVAISGTRVVVGASGDDTGADNAGSAYVYDLSSGTPTVPVATLNNPSSAASDSFGTSVAISGTRVVVGASGDDTGADDAGSAYVYDLSSGTPVPAATLNNPSPAVGDGFGGSVAIAGTRVVVAASGDDTGAFNAGSAYVYDLSSGTPAVPVTTLNNPSPADSDRFSSSVAISGTRVVVGAQFDNTGAGDAGSAYVYDLSSGTPTVPVATLNNPTPLSNEFFGGSVAISGTRVVVGASGERTGGPEFGSAYVYDLSSGTPTVPVATLDNPDPAQLDRFGRSVAIDGVRIAIGVPFDDSPQVDKGSVYIYGPANVAPVAQDQSVSTAENTPKAITLSASDGNGDALAFSVVTGPAHGVLSGTAPNLTYTPNAGYSGADSFTFKANDGQLDSNIGTVSITVNDVPEPSPSVSPTPSATPTPTPSLLGNISTRLRVETGDDVLIGGFIVTGSEPKKLIIRAIGPSLPVEDKLQNPELELYDSSGQLIRANDDWQDAPNRQEIVDSTIPPNDPLESAILMTLPAGGSAYTAQVRGVNGGTGVGLVEVFDLGQAAKSKLANISTRGLVQTGENVMIGGFFILHQSQKVIIRALGPSLPIEGKLADPTLGLFNSNGDLIVANENWRDTQESQIIATTIPPSHDLEAAIVATLPPAPYTAIVRGAGDGTGVGLVEVYALD